jgi:hypothetical protein
VSFPKDSFVEAGIEKDLQSRFSSTWTRFKALYLSYVQYTPVGPRSWGTKPNDVFRGVVVSAVETTPMMMSRNFRNDAPCSGFVMKSPTISVVLHHSNVDSPWETLSQIKEIANVDMLCSPAAGRSAIFLQKIALLLS